VKLNFITHEDLLDGDQKGLESKLASDRFEREILLQWLRGKKKLEKLGRGFEFDMQDFIQRNELFLQMHLACSNVI